MMAVIGRWGAMFPESHGQIIEVTDGQAKILWEDGVSSWTPLAKIHREYKTAVGIYFNPES